MKTLLSKLLPGIATAVCVGTVTTICVPQSAQAASFKFTFTLDPTTVTDPSFAQFSTSFTGLLSFNNIQASSALGNGTGTFGLSSLGSQANFQVGNYTKTILVNGQPLAVVEDMDGRLYPIISAPLFTFKNGILIGIQSLAAIDPVDNGLSVYISGTQVNYFPILDFFNGVYGTCNGPCTGLLAGTGTINIQTISPYKSPTSVPEPATIVSLGMLGLWFLFDRKRTRKTTPGRVLL